MSKKKPKFYVVWKGKQTGVFDSWAECQTQIAGFQNAVYKSYENKEAAKTAFLQPIPNFFHNSLAANVLPPAQTVLFVGKPILPSIVVDGACSSRGGLSEYKGINLENKQIIFSVGPFFDGTNNMVEFLAIVHALAYCAKNGMDWPVYSDSKIAISWVAARCFKTNLERSDKNIILFERAEAAVTWLKNNIYPNKVLKWQTQHWGENPADFGRK